MNKKKIGYLFIQFFFVVMSFFIIYLDKISGDSVEVKRVENKNLREEVKKIETDYLQVVGNDKKEEEANLILKYILLKKQQDEKEKQIEELEKEMEGYKKEKAKWESQIATLK